MKQPGDCTNMADIREAIYYLDREIIGFIGRRAGYVRVAAKFKTGEADVRAPERQNAVLKARREWAEEEGLDPEVIQKVYRDLISYFVDREFEDWRADG